MEIQDSYKSIAAPSEGLFKDNGSRFIALAYPVETEEEVKEIVASLRKEYHDARHHCYAYRIGLKGDVWRASDDGEPSGSAGRPILGQIDSLGLSDILVVVVRYFGGIKLGIPISFDYMNMNAVMKVLKDLDLPQSGQDFGEKCSLVTRVRLAQDESFKERLFGIAELKEI